MYSNFKEINQDVGGSQDVRQTLTANVWHNLTKRDGEKELK